MTTEILLKFRKVFKFFGDILKNIEFIVSEHDIKGGERPKKKKYLIGTALVKNKWLRIL